MADFNVMTTLPASELFAFPPVSVPDALPPAPVPFSLMRPFNIPDGLFTAALDTRVPITIALTYAVVVKSLTQYNKSRGKKAWPISKTRPFFAFVVAHNIFLAVYSAWTFFGMLSAMRRTIISPMGPGGMAATVDSFCRLHGSPGLGNSIFYDESTHSWASNLPDASIVNGVPSATQEGRLWNEGLAYYGWLFYISKFYEVLDTFIILAKGKPSSTLQTYHHAGAMMCMWAGIRFMSCPIWVFVLFNSFIHSLMYFYYTLTAFSVKVPVGIKRTLTSMQITQFVLGASSAMIHSFISYVVPIAVAAGTASAPAASPAASTLGSLKQMVFGGNDGQEDSHSYSVTVANTVQPCIMTSGETLAIWLNVFYLAPLTYLFASFFVASYVKRSHAANKVGGGNRARRLSGGVALAEKAGWDAARSVEREVYGGENMVNGAPDSPIEEEVKRSPKANGKTRRRG